MIKYKDIKCAINSGNRATKLFAAMSKYLLALTLKPFKSTCEQAQTSYVLDDGCHRQRTEQKKGCGDETRKSTALLCFIRLQVGAQWSIS